MVFHYYSLYRLISNITSSRSHRVRCIMYLWFFRVHWENTDKEVVVEDKSISLVMSIVSITPAVRVVTSYWNGSAESITVKLDKSLDGVTFVPDHEDTDPP